jgi:hypothetical protein
MNQEPEWTPEEDEAFNQVEQQSNLGKQILRDMKSNTRYTVCVEGHSPMYWDNIHDAITCAQRGVYSGPTNTTRALDDLKAGRIAEWSYGFSAVRIYPPQKVFDAYEQGRQAGMAQERALWIMQAEGQKIEQPRPLSEDKKLELISQIKGIRGRVFGDSQLLDLIDAVEAAHGIKEQS